MAAGETWREPPPGLRPTVRVDGGGGPTAGAEPDPARPHDLLADLPAPLRAALAAPPDLRGETALVTGASPGSIAAELVRRLLGGGATVVVATSTDTPARRRWYRELYRLSAGPGAELHVLPANLASFADVDALAGWLADPRTAARGRPDLRIDPLRPTIVAPFAAMATAGDAASAGAPAELALRLHLLGVQRLIGAVAAAVAEGAPAPSVLLALSPNHGGFGGDGAYGETKAALEVLLARWRSEAAAWGDRVALVAPRIGWVRGTGLMASGDGVAALVERRLGARTFSAEEMGWLLCALAGPGPLRDAATRQPLEIDLTGGLGEDRRPARCGRAARRRAAGARPARAAGCGAARRPRRPRRPRRHDAGAGAGPAGRRHRYRQARCRGRRERRRGTAPAVDLAELVVIVGCAELGPCGSGAARFDLEADGALAPGSVAELAWMCGLVRVRARRLPRALCRCRRGRRGRRGGARSRYAEAVAARIGVRSLRDDETVDAAGRTVLTALALPTDVRFTVDDEAQARAFAAADPAHARVRHDGAAGTWQVLLRAGAQIRIPRSVAYTRRVAGQLPDGLDLARFGLPADLLATADRMALVNLACTVEAFADAGVTPEELLGEVHPALVGNTQGCGLGGMASTRRVVLDHLLDGERPPDRLQEALGNVVAAHTVGSLRRLLRPDGPSGRRLRHRRGLARGRARQDPLRAGAGHRSPAASTTSRRRASSASATWAPPPPATTSTRWGSRRTRARVPTTCAGAASSRRRAVARCSSCAATSRWRWGCRCAACWPTRAASPTACRRRSRRPGWACSRRRWAAPTRRWARSLARLGLSADDIAVVSKHDTSTELNDTNEADLHERVQAALGRTPGNPLLVVSQKTVTGHAKGGAAVWQVDGMLRMMQTGVVPGNRNLESADPLLRDGEFLTLGDRSLRLAPQEPIRAGLVTSLGFGHVSALLALPHPDTFLAAVPEQQRDDYLRRAGRRRAEGVQQRLRTRLGRPAAVRRSDRRLGSDDPAAAREAEAALLTDPSARLRAHGAYGPPSPAA